MRDVVYDSGDRVIVEIDETEDTRLYLIISGDDDRELPLTILDAERVILALDAALSAVRSRNAARRDRPE